MWGFNRVNGLYLGVVLATFAVRGVLSMKQVEKMWWSTAISARYR
jgi:hypothetical protein